MRAGRDEQVYAAHERLLGPLAAKFGLDVTNFAILLGYPTPEAATPLFTQFDTDANGLVDAFEVLGVVAMAAQMSVVDRVKFFFKMFDFNKSGLISKDELVILHSSIVAGCAKVNKSVSGYICIGELLCVM